MKFPYKFSFTILVLSTTTVTNAYPSSSSAPTAPTIAWSNCTAQDPPGLECGVISVPIDHDCPQGDQITLTMARLKASGDTRLGSLLYNPGGPGGVATHIVFVEAKGVKLFGDDILKNYDIIGLDPRGVGLSTPIKCDPNLYNPPLSSTPKTEEEYSALSAHNKAFGESCAKLTGPLINHLDTMNVAKDMELVRSALNDGKLNYLGESYGTEIGAAYAELYPENINRMVLDGVVDHSQSHISTVDVTVSAYEQTLNEFFRWCNTTSDCALQGKDAAAIFDSLIQTAKETPIPAPGCESTGETPCSSNVTYENLLVGIQEAIAYKEPSETLGTGGWPALSAIIALAAEGNATALSPPLFLSETSDRFPIIAISCQDWIRGSTSIDDINLEGQMTAVIAPHTQGITGFHNQQGTCIGWPAPVTNPQHYLDKRVSKAPQILLVNSLYDPATSIVWAHGLLGQLPDAVLLTRNGSGHTSYHLLGDASKAIDTFFVKGELPKQGSVVDS